MKAVVYCRVSSKEQIEGTSLEVQEAACREYARVKGIDIIKVFVEQGESAKFADRTQLVELLDFCRTNKGSVNSLLVWKVDRFARNVADHFSIKATLGKYGVNVLSVTESIEANPEGRLMETILAGFAQFDNDIRAVRTVQGMRRKLQEGIFPWRPPFGYKSPNANGEKKTQPDVPDQQVFGLLQKAWREFATGSYTKAEIGRRMQTWGLSSPIAGTFGPQSLASLFTNRYYAGVLVDPWSGEEYEGKHAPMVTREDFARVQRVIARRSRIIVHKKERAEFPLRGLVRCHACSEYMMGSFSRGRNQRYAYYWCKSKHCSNRSKSYPASDVHKEFKGLLETVTPTEQAVRDLGDRIILAIDRRRSGQDAVKARRSASIKNLNRQLDELIRMRTQGLVTDQEFMHRKKAIVSQRDEIQSRDGQFDDLKEIRTQLGAIVAPLVQLGNTREAMAPGLRRRFDRILLPIGFTNGNSRTAELGLLFSTIGTSAHSDSPEVALTSEKLNHIISEIQALWVILKDAENPTSESENVVLLSSPE